MPTANSVNKLRDVIAKGIELNLKIHILAVPCKTSSILI